jgi:hypothetical protein
MQHHISYYLGTNSSYFMEEAKKIIFLRSQNSKWKRQNMGEGEPEAQVKDACLSFRTHLHGQVSFQQWQCTRLPRRLWTGSMSTLGRMLHMQNPSTTQTYWNTACRITVVHVLQVHTEVWGGTEEHGCCIIHGPFFSNLVNLCKIIF